MWNPLQQVKVRRSESAVKRAFELAADRRFVEAISTAREADPQAASPELQTAALVWRNQVFAEAPASRGRPDWPPKIVDPFPDLVDQIPEIKAGALTADLLGGAVLHHGSLIVRGLFDKPATDRLVADIDHAYQAKTLWYEGVRNPEDNAWYSVVSGIDNAEIASARVWMAASSALMADSPMFVARWTKALKACGVHDAVALYLGEQPVLSTMKATLYRVPPDAMGQWHQDGAFLGADTRTINLWVALTDCGRDAPGLDIVPWRLNEIVPCGTHGAHFDWSVGEGKVRELASGRRTVLPEFKAGDAILFDHLCLHSTGVRPGMTRTRYAIESWMFAPSRYPAQSSLYI